MSVKIFFRTVTGVFNDYVTIELSKLIPGRYRIGGISYLSTPSTNADHVFITTQHYLYGDFIYKSYWNIVRDKACYCWFLDLRVSTYAVSTTPFVLHQIPGFYASNVLLSEVTIGEGNHTVWSGGSIRMQEQENDSYKAFLRDVSLASLM